ncbi:hypothetical protein [Actinoplanes sp. NPDC049118]|uniref:hypothetical protein n=1 Tax=Actinoplanes sp. NPDC049118 TaxID=3155769 RepID=UPI0033CDACF4
MKRNKVFRAAAITFAATAVMLGATATAAQAHQLDMNNGSDFAWVTRDHRSVYVCDNEADNHGVWVDYATAAGHSYVARDPDGKGGDCGHQFPPDGSRIVRARLCEQNADCTPFRNA